MEQKHTPEPWRVTGTGTIRYIDAPVGNGMLQEVASCMRVEYGDMEANARRIVACVNACKNIPTERLEMALPGQMKTSLDNLCAEIEKLESQRDMLLEALEEIEAMSEYEMLTHGVLACRAAIAAVKGDK